MDRLELDAEEEREESVRVGREGRSTLLYVAEELSTASSQERSRVVVRRRGSARCQRFEDSPASQTHLLVRSGTNAATLPPLAKTRHIPTPPSSAMEPRSLAKGLKSAWPLAAFSLQRRRGANKTKRRAPVRAKAHTSTQLRRSSFPSRPSSRPHRTHPSQRDGEQKEADGRAAHGSTAARKRLQALSHSPHLPRSPNPALPLQHPPRSRRSLAPASLATSFPASAALTRCSLLYSQVVGCLGSIKLLVELLVVELAVLDLEQAESYG